MNKEYLVKIGALILPIVFFGFFLKLVANIGNPDSSSLPTPAPANITPSPTRPSCLTAQQASNYYNQYVSCVRYYVGHPVKFSNGSEVLNERSDYWNGFSVFIPYSIIDQFGISTPDGEDIALDPADYYKNSWIDVSGYITPYYTKYNYMPEIIILSPAQIRIEY